MQKCTVCGKRSSKAEHRCIVCDNVYGDVDALAKHQKDRGHIGGHYPDGGPLTRPSRQSNARSSRRRLIERRDGLDEEEERLGLNEDADDLLVDDVDGADDVRAPPPLGRSGGEKAPRSNTNVNINGNNNNNDDDDDDDADVDDKAPPDAGVASRRSTDLVERTPTSSGTSTTSASSTSGGASIGTPVTAAATPGAGIRSPSAKRAKRGEPDDLEFVRDASGVIVSWRCLLCKASGKCSQGYKSNGLRHCSDNAYMCAQRTSGAAPQRSILLSSGGVVKLSATPKLVRVISKA